MPTVEVEAKRQQFRTEVVEPHMASCPACQKALGWLKNIERKARQQSDMPDVRPVDEDSLTADEKVSVENGWNEYLNGRYYEFDEMICCGECPELDQLFVEYFATL